MGSIPPARLFFLFFAELGDDGGGGKVVFGLLFWLVLRCGRLA